MICPKCLGFRYQAVGGLVFEPCDYCDGAGHVHCCEGACEQPDGNEDGIAVGSSTVQAEALTERDNDV